MKYVAIIQARMNSSRLPGKVMMKILNKPTLVYLINRLKTIKEINTIIIATTNNIQDDVLKKLALKLKIKCFRGSENNVLKRVVQAGVKNKAKNIIHICGDNPILDPNIIKKMLKIFTKSNYDCVANSFKRSYPRGMDAIVIKLSALKKSLKFAKNNKYKEHVSLFIKHNPGKFKIKNIIAEKKMYWPSLSVSLDEKADFLLIKKIIEYFNMNKKQKYFGCYEIIELLKNQKPHWININKYVKRKS